MGRSAVLDHGWIGDLWRDAGRKPGGPALVPIGRMGFGSRDLSTMAPSVGVEDPETIVEGDDIFAEKCGKPIEKVRKIRYTHI